MANRKNIFLIAKYVAMPKNPKMTAQAGYMTNPDNIRYDEQVYITRGLKDRDLKNHVILDLTEEKIVKNSFKSGKDFIELFAHFHEGYSEYIDRSVNQLNEALQPK